MLKQELIDKTQIALCEKEEQLEEKQQILNTKLEHINHIENLLGEAKEQGEQLKASSTENSELVITLQQQLSEEGSKVQFLTQKLFDNKQIMRRLFKELGSFIDDQSETSPVIKLKPEYANKGSEDKIAQS